MLNHLTSRSQYNALRDVISEKVKNIFSKNNNHIVPETELFWALRNISFEVKDGERIGIIGRNGAGKSTLLKILSRITEPSTGKVSIKGRVASLLEVGTGFHPELSGRENIFLNGAILGMSRGEIKSKFDEIVAFAEVEKFLDTPVKRYSSGMYVRLAFAVAAHLEPEILVVDEVLAVGDSQFQRKCLSKMQDVSKNGRTVLFVSHNMAAIQNLCNKCIYLKSGYLQEQGDSPRVISAYLHSSFSDIALDLYERKDRKGDGQIRFTSVNIKDEFDNPINAFQSGSNGKLCVNFKIKVPILNNFHLSVGIDDEMGQRITSLSTDATDDEFPPMLGNTGTVEVMLKRIPFRKGTYTFTLFAKANGEIVDWVQSAGKFDVETGDFYMTGKLPSEGQGNFLIDHSFYYRS
jgi:lipopolysaccharide transport system ATP-binding protein